MTADPQDPIPVQVLDGRGQWRSGFLLLEFRPDGLVTVLSERTGVTRDLPLDRWRDPQEEAILCR